MSEDSKRLWAEIQHSNDVSELADFFNTFPATPEAYLARRRHSALTKAERAHDELYDNYFHLEGKFPNWDAATCARVRVNMCKSFIADNPDYYNLDEIRKWLDISEKDYERQIQN